jgi:hypothetical protein
MAPVALTVDIDEVSEEMKLCHVKSNENMAGASTSLLPPKSSSEPLSNGKPSDVTDVTPTRGPRLRVAKSIEMSGRVPRTYFIHKSNGWKLVKASMDKRGWQQLPFDYNFSNRFGLKWVERRSQIDYKGHTAGQLVNHIPNNDVITTKTGLLQAMRALYKNKRPMPWLPETWELESPADIAELIRVTEDRLKSSKKADMFIYKPAGANRGRGIHVFKGLDALKRVVAGEDHIGVSSSIVAGDSSDDEVFASNDETEDVNKTMSSSKSTTSVGKAQPSPSRRSFDKGSKDKDGKSAPSPLRRSVDGKSSLSEPSPNRRGKSGLPSVFKKKVEGIVQRYLENPLLVNGYKFDLRVYLLIASNSPNYMAFFHSGYCRMTVKKYDPSDAAIDDVSVHLTNNSIQKNDPEFEKMREFSIQSPSAVADLLRAEGLTSSADYIMNDLDHQVKQCMVDVVKAAIPKMQRKSGFFDLLGLDFMLDTENKLYLIEANTNPTLAQANSTLAALLPGVVDGAIDIVLKSQGPEKISNDEILADVPEGYDLIFDEESGFEYTGDKK